MTWVEMTENDWYYAIGLILFLQIYMSWMFARQLKKHGELKPNVSQHGAPRPKLKPAKKSG